MLWKIWHKKNIHCLEEHNLNQVPSIPKGKDEPNDRAKSKITKVLKKKYTMNNSQQKNINSTNNNKTVE